MCNIAVVWMRDVCIFRQKFMLGNDKIYDLDKN